MDKKVIVTGKAHYCFTSKVNDKGNFPSNCYEVCVIPEKITGEDDAVSFFNTHFIKNNTNTGVTYVRCANSKYPFKIFDKDNNRINSNIAIQNDTTIAVAFEMKNKNGRDYLICNGIKLKDDFKEYNPFNDFEF